MAAGWHDAPALVPSSIQLFLRGERRSKEGMTQHLSIRESWRQAATLRVYTPIENFFVRGHRKQSRNFRFFIGIRHVSACQPWERKGREGDRGGRNWPAGLSIPRSWKPGTNDLNIPDLSGDQSTPTSIRCPPFPCFSWIQGFFSKSIYLDLHVDPVLSNACPQSSSDT